jgi:hypothetical protein
MDAMGVVKTWVSEVNLVDPDYAELHQGVLNAVGSTFLPIPESWVESAYDAVREWVNGRLWSDFGIVVEWAWTDGRVCVRVVHDPRGVAKPPVWTGE